MLRSCFSVIAVFVIVDNFSSNPVWFAPDGNASDVGIPRLLLSFDFELVFAHVSSGFVVIS